MLKVEPWIFGFCSRSWSCSCLCCVSALDGCQSGQAGAGPALAPYGSCTVCPAGLPVCPLCMGLAVGAPSSSCFGRREAACPVLNTEEFLF